MSNPINLFGQYVPAGSYQITSRKISVTIMATCQTSNGDLVPSQITYSTDQVAGIGDITNMEGVLTLAPGSGSAPNPTNQFGEYIPAGSYQLTTSEVYVTISASCEASAGNWLASQITYSTGDAAGINDIANMGGTLTITN